jgi:hypothetical protein
MLGHCTVGLSRSDVGIREGASLPTPSTEGLIVYCSSGSLLGWLKTLAHHAWRELAAERRRSRLGAGDRSVREEFRKLEGLE